MNFKKPTFIIFAFTLFNGCLGTYIKQCNVIGKYELFNIYNNYNPNILNIGQYIKIKGNPFEIGYCECSTTNGNCLVEFTYNANNGTYYKFIYEYEYQNYEELSQRKYFEILADTKTNLTNPNFNDLNNDYILHCSSSYISGEKMVKLLDYKPNPEKASIYFSFDYVTFADDLVLTKTEFYAGNLFREEAALYIYLLYYTPEIPEEYYKYFDNSGPYLNGLNIPDNYLYNFGGYTIQRTLECISDNKEFIGNNTVRKTFALKNNPLDIDCSWGERNNRFITLDDNGFITLYENVLKLLLLPIFLTLGFLF